MTEDGLKHIKLAVPGTRVSARANFEIACRNFGRAFRATPIIRICDRILDWLAARLLRY